MKRIIRTADSKGRTGPAFDILSRNAERVVFVGEGVEWKTWLPVPKPRPPQ